MLLGTKLDFAISSSSGHGVMLPRRHCILGTALWSTVLNLCISSGKHGNSLCHQQIMTIPYEVAQLLCPSHWETKPSFHPFPSHLLQGTNSDEVQIIQNMYFCAWSNVWVTHIGLLRGSFSILLISTDRHGISIWHKAGVFNLF